MISRNDALINVRCLLHKNNFLKPEKKQILEIFIVLSFLEKLTDLLA